MKKIALIIVLLIISVFVYFVFFAKEDKKDASIIDISGSIEVIQIDTSFLVSGQIIEIIPQEGDKIKKGQLLARLDDADINQSIEIAKSGKKTYESQIPALDIKIEESEKSTEKELALSMAVIEEARLRYESFAKGSREEDINRTRYAVSQAKHIMENKKKDYERAENLYNKGAIPAQQRDALKTDYLTAADQYQQVQAVYKLTLEGPRKEDVEASYSKLKQAESNYETIKTKELKAEELKKQKKVVLSQIKQSEELIKQAELNRLHTKLYSPIDGTVLIRAKEAGEVVSAGMPVLTIANLNDVYFKAYVAETDLGKIKLGQSVTVKTDSYPDKKYEGTIYYISDSAEFTPKNLTAKDDRVKLVYRIKVKLENESQELKPGMIADGVINSND